jgi:biotin carboxyl carrier protein
MKFDIKLQRGTKSMDHHLEFVSAIEGQHPTGVIHFVLDGKLTEAQCEEISPGLYSILVEGLSYEAHVAKRPGDPAGLLSPYAVTVGLRQYLVEICNPRRWLRGGRGLVTEGPQEILAPMPGRIVKVLVRENDEVQRDQGLVVIEAMKMQNELRTSRAGRVEKVHVTEGTGVEAGARLLRLV